MKFLEWLPDLYRYKKTEAPQSKLIAGAVLVSIICLVVYASHTNTDIASWEGLLKIYFFLQAFAWVIMSSAQTSSAVSSEKSQRTWDFQRLTPLTSTQTALGKLLGAPMFSYAMGALVMPWALYAGYHAGLDVWFIDLIGLVALSFTVNSLGLLFSSSSAISDGRIGAAAGPVLGVIAILVYTALSFTNSASTVVTTVFYGVSIRSDLFAIMSALAFGIWAFLGAKWQIGRDYLEPRRVWRNPAFLVFMALYMGGFEKQFIVHTGLFLLFGILYFEVAGTAGENSFGDWWSQKRVNDTPLWLSGWITMLAITLGVCLLNSTLLPLSMIGFALRDLSLLEGARYLRFKQARVFMGVVIMLLYILPLILGLIWPGALVAFHPLGWIHNQTSEMSMQILNLASALVQGALAFGLVRTIERART